MAEDKQQHPRAWMATILLAITAMIAMADKTLPSLLMEPIKHAMSLSDTEIGMLTGFTFAISMSLAALPLAWLADRYDRAMLLGIAIAVWCLMTIASGFAHDFTTLFIFRLGVGIGEAALFPASLSLIADLFPVNRVARASAVLTYAGSLGSFAAMAGGGGLYELLHAAALAGRLPFPPEDAWRWTTIAFGVVGLLVALVAATFLPEPRRQARKAGMAARPSGSVITYLPKAAFFFIPFILCTSIYSVFAAGFMGWLAPFFTRTYGWSVGQIGSILGLATLLGGLSGPIVGVFFSRMVSRWLGREAPVATINTLLTIALPVVMLAPFSPNGVLAAVAFGIVAALTGGCAIVVSVVYATMAPSYLRARLVAVIALSVGLLASTGSVVYAAFTDLVLGDPARLYLTLSLLSGVLIAISIVIGIICDRKYDAVVALARASEHPADSAAPAIDALAAQPAH
jgi:predicted MFS family arabinose efflux permease